MIQGTAAFGYDENTTSGTGFLRVYYPSPAGT
jgi:hypothetical protein